MELGAVLDRFAEGLVAIDAGTLHTSANRRTGEAYLQGVKTMIEPVFVGELLDWWRKTHGSDFAPRSASAKEVPYPAIAREKCDLVFSTDGSPLATPEWAIEVKHVALVGNNGKNNDFGVAKILSPYLKDRSLIHDVRRLRDFGIGKRKAVVGYCFDYNFKTCEEALRRHPQQRETVENLREVCRKNDPRDGEYSVVPMVEFADEIFRMQGLVKPVETRVFMNAWRHPCGGRGTVFGWEVREH